MTVRNSTSLLVVLVGVLALGAAITQAQTTGWEGEAAKYQIEARYFLVDDLEASTLATGLVGGNSIDLVKDVGLEEDNHPELRFSFLPNETNRVRIGYLRLRLEGAAPVAGTFYFAGSRFGAGSEVEADVEQDYFYVNWAIEPLEFGDGALRFGPVVGLHGWTSRVEMENAAPAVEDEEHFNNVIPAFGLAADWTPHKVVSVFFEGSGMHQGADGWHLDIEAGLKICPIKALAIVAAYRDLTINNEDDKSNNFAKWRLQGPFVGLDYRF